MLSASAWLWDGLHSVSYKIVKRQQLHSWEGKTVCLNDTYKRYFCIKAGNWATYSLLKIKRPLEECSSSPPAPYPNPQLTDFLIRLGQRKGKEFKPTRPCEVQKSKAWGMEAMSPGSMAEVDRLVHEGGDSAQAHGSLCIQTWLNTVLSNLRLPSFLDSPSHLSETPGFCCRLSDILRLQGRLGASLQERSPANAPRN